MEFSVNLEPLLVNFLDSYGIIAKTTSHTTMINSKTYKIMTCTRHHFSFVTINIPSRDDMHASYVFRTKKSKEHTNL